MQYFIIQGHNSKLKGHTTKIMAYCTISDMIHDILNRLVLIVSNEYTEQNFSHLMPILWQYPISLKGWWVKTVRFFLCGNLLSSERPQVMRFSLPTSTGSYQVRLHESCRQAGGNPHTKRVSGLLRTRTTFV